MKRFTRLTAKILLLTFITFQGSPYLLASEIYRWIDNNGKIHFSDQKPNNSQTELYSLNEIQKINFAPSPNIQFRSQNHKVKTRRTSKNTTISYCSRIKQSIKNIEQNLRKKLAAKDFDNLNKKLDNLRWQKIKKC